MDLCALFEYINFLPNLFFINDAFSSLEARCYNKEELRPLERTGLFSLLQNQKYGKMLLITNFEKLVPGTNTVIVTIQETESAIWAHTPVLYSWGAQPFRFWQNRRCCQAAAAHHITTDFQTLRHPSL